MSGVGLGLAVIGTVDLCFKYGQQLLEKYDSFKAAEREISERAVSLASRWKRISLQLKFLKQIWSSLDEEYQCLQDQVLQILIRKLELAVLQVSKVQTTYNPASPSRVSRLKRWRYASLVKESLDSAILELEAWQTIFDPSWYLIIRVANPVIDAELARQTPEKTALSVATRLRRTLAVEPAQNEQIFLPASGISKFQILGIPFSVARTLQQAEATTLILDHAECHLDANSVVLTKDVRTLARRLRNTEPVEFGLLECFGVVKNQDERTGRTDSFDFIFKIPGQMRNPRSLRDHLNSDMCHSLSDTFALAKRLAISISYVHTLGFVHKNIQPETILIFDNGISPLGWSALVGFRSIRMADGKTLRHGDADWDRNLYRHPDRQGLLPESDYTMQHDIYSLGVCMLEIGLWKSFVAYDQSGAPSRAQTRTNFPEISSSNTKDTLVRLASDVLPQRMGNKFAKVVSNCLTCMDQDNRDFGDEDGILIGVKYIEKILLQLDAISI